MAGEGGGRDQSSKPSITSHFLNLTWLFLRPNSSKRHWRSAVQSYQSELVLKERKERLGHQTRTPKGPVVRHGKLGASAGWSVTICRYVLSLGWERVGQVGYREDRARRFASFLLIRKLAGRERKVDVKIPFFWDILWVNFMHLYEWIISELKLNCKNDRMSLQSTRLEQLLLFKLLFG